MRKNKSADEHSHAAEFSRLVFACDPVGSVCLWQDPFTDARPGYVSGELALRFLNRDVAQVREAFAAAAHDGHAVFSGTLHHGGHQHGPPLDFRIERLQIGSQRLFLGFTRGTPEQTHHRTEKALQERELRLRHISAVATDVMWDLNFETGESWHSEDAAQVFGYPTDTTLEIAKWWLKQIHPEDRGGVEASFQDYLQHGSGDWQQTYRMRRADGSYAHVHDRGRAARDPAGKCLRVVGAMVDISARVEAEEKLKLASQALEHIAEGILILDERLCILSCNRAYSDITGLTLAELAGLLPYGLRDGVIEPALQKEILSLVANTGHWRGELQNRRADGSTYPELMSLSAVRDGAGKLSQYVAVVTDMTQLHSYEDRMAFLASHDALSGLPNRFMLMRRLTQTVTYARDSRGLAALLYVDLDNFKLVNNSFGTSVGDEALRLLAQRLRESVVGWGEAFHLGSDGFAVLLPKIASPRQARDMAEDILVRLEEPLECHGQHLYLSASIGITVTSADADAQSLYRQAKTALQLAQRRGPSGIEQFSGVEVDSSQSLLLVNGLRQALEHGELFLHYQPYFDLQSGEVSGVEALLRWQHPELGLVPPARVIPLAEETGHIMRLGDWVLRTACTQMRAWQDAGLNDMHVAVNVSARQLRRPDFLARLTQTLDETGLLPGSLVLELTESSMMENPDRAREVFQQLHELGVGIAIDDFGTGYSSLNYLRHYQVDYLKVDRAFVSNLPHDEHQQAIIRAIIVMAKSLGIQVIAEGVETAAQWEFLKTLECEQGQGFLFARPQAAARVESLLRAGPMDFLKLQ